MANPWQRMATNREAQAWVMGAQGNEGLIPLKMPEHLPAACKA
jgi:hypothetical protein